MVFVNRDHGGSCWIVRIPASGRERFFRTPGDHALAVVTSAIMDGLTRRSGRDPAILEADDASLRNKRL